MWIHCRDGSSTMPPPTPLSPSLGCKSLEPSFLMGDQSIWFNCSFYRWESEHLRLRQVTASGRIQAVLLLPGAPSFSSLFALVLTTYTNLAISEQDKPLMSMNVYSSQRSNLFPWWIVKRTGFHFQPHQNLCTALVSSYIRKL